MKLTIYMKSGNVITLRNIKEYEIGNRGDEVVHFKITTGLFCSKRLLVKTIALNQIEAVVVSKLFMSK